MEIAMGAIGPLLLKLGVLLMGELVMEEKVRKGIKSLGADIDACCPLQGGQSAG